MTDCSDLTAPYAELARLIEVAGGILRRPSNSGDPADYVSDETKLAARADDLARDIRAVASTRQ